CPGLRSAVPAVPVLTAPILSFPDPYGKSFAGKSRSSGTGYSFTKRTDRFEDPTSSLRDLRPFGVSESQKCSSKKIFGNFLRKCRDWVANTINPKPNLEGNDNYEHAQNNVTSRSVFALRFHSRRVYLLGLFPRCSSS